jgi:hypothetical protein
VFYQAVAAQEAVATPPLPLIAAAAAAAAAAAGAGAGAGAASAAGAGAAAGAAGAGAAGAAGAAAAAAAEQVSTFEPCVPVDLHSRVCACHVHHNDQVKRLVLSFSSGFVDGLGVSKTLDVFEIGGPKRVIGF